MEYHDRVLKCAECGAEFVFTAGEQMFFADKGFKNEPKRCKGCKAKRAEGGGGGGGGASQMRSETKTTCSQ
ncbi:MAG: zinc-ribbon domain-containing protein, partial [Candidatus Acidiferrum sp.]